MSDEHGLAAEVTGGLGQRLVAGRTCSRLQRGLFGDMDGHTARRQPEPQCHLLDESGLLCRLRSKAVIDTNHLDRVPQSLT